MKLSLRGHSAAWTAIGLLILVQYLLFRQYVVRELVWAYPAHHDQSNFLQDALTYYQNMLDQGFWRGLWSGFESPRVSSVMLPIQGALVFYFFGPDRLHALTLVFAYFALLQVAMVHTIRQLTGSWPHALVALGLLLSTSSRFFEAGGTADFRADSIAASLYGVTLCCFLLSDRLQDSRWSWLTILAAALLCWFRPIAGTYLVGVALLLLAFGQIRFAARYAAAFVALTLPMIVICRQAIYSYYVVGHVTGPEKQIRAIEQGVRSTFDNLVFYPRSLFTTHLSSAAVWLWTGLAAAGLLGLAASLYKNRSKPAPSDKWSIAVLFIWAVTPLAILTSDYSKSAVVASVAVGPTILLATYLLTRLAAGPRGLLLVMSGGALLIGMTRTADAEGRRYVPREDIAQTKALTTTYRELAAYCEHFGIGRPLLATDRIVPYVMQTAVGVMMFEAGGFASRPKEILSHDLYSRTVSEAEQAAHKADIAMVTVDPVERSATSFYPFDRSASAWQSAYGTVVSREMLPISRISLSNHEFEIFVRPRVKLRGDSHGWLTNDGARIRTSAAALYRWPIIRLSGQTVGSKHLGGPVGCTATAEDELHNRTQLPARVTIAPDESYVIEIDGSSLQSPGSKPMSLELRFDRYFVPKELGVSSDDRKLVLQSPTSATMTSHITRPATPVTLDDLLMQ